MAPSEERPSWGGHGSASGRDWSPRAAPWAFGQVLQPTGVVVFAMLSGPSGRAAAPFVVPGVAPDPSPAGRPHPATWLRWRAAAGANWLLGR